MIKSFVADSSLVGLRLDAAISAYDLELSRSAAQKLIEAGRVTVNEAAQNKKYKLAIGDRVQYEVDALSEFVLTPYPCQLDIVYEDEHLAVVNKPKGMVVHPGAANENDTLAAALLHKYGKAGLSDINGDLRPGIVHRIDKDTSGLLIVAKNNIAHENLAKQIKEHTFTRSYMAVCVGNIKEDRFLLEGYIARNPKDRKKMALVGNEGRYARTEGEVVARYGAFTTVKLNLFTGRTHQIRVQMAGIGHPVAGDTVYGSKKSDKLLEGQCLHAATIGFDHPITGEYLEFTADLPAYFKRYIDHLEKTYGRQ